MKNTIRNENAAAPVGEAKPTKADLLALIDDYESHPHLSHNWSLHRPTDGFGRCKLGDVQCSKHHREHTGRATPIRIFQQHQISCGRK